MITELFLELAIKKPALRVRTVTAVFIANEENGVVQGIGVDRLMSSGKMDRLKVGPIIWVDRADSQPCIGTAGSDNMAPEGDRQAFPLGAACASRRNSAQLARAAQCSTAPPLAELQGINALVTATVAQLRRSPSPC